MQNLYIYLGKQMLVAGILLGYYWLALRNTRFHYYNRFYLVGSFLLSLLLPLVDLNWFAVEPPQNYAAQQLIYFIDQPGLVSIAAKEFSWELLGVLVVLSVSAFLLGRMLLGIVRIFQLKRYSAVTPMDGFDFIETSAEEAPFSFFKNLFWRKDISLEEVTGKNILSHELAHIRDRHSYDKIFVSLFTNLFWFNPFFWLFRKEISIIHEFIADEKSVEQSDAAALAAMLLATYDHQQYSNASQSFFYSSIKRRLNMLTSSKKTSYSYLRRILILPVSMGMLFLLSFTLAHNSVTTVSVSKEATSLKETMNERVAFRVLIPDTTPTKKSTKEYRVKSVGDSLIFLDSKTGKFLFKLPQTAIAPPPPPPLTFRQLPKNAKILLVVDGKPMSQEEVNKIPPSNIETINVRQGKDMVPLYGEIAQEGVILITTKSGSKLTNDSVITVVGRPMHKLPTLDADKDKVITVTGHPLSENDHPKTRVLVTFDKEIAMIALEKDSGVSISVSNEDGRKKYTIQKPVVKEQSLPEGLLYIVNGKRISQEEFKATITPDKIKSINVLKGKSATEKYGAEGANGVLEIQLK